MSECLTVEKLTAAMRQIPRVPALPRIIFTATALENSEERTFPASRHRSARIRKKLLRRHGGEFKQKPAIWQIGYTICAHPSFEAEIKRQFTHNLDLGIEGALYSGNAGPLRFGGIPMFGGPLYYKGG